MSNEEIKIKDAVMEKIRHDEIKMRPTIYYIGGSILMLVGLVASVVLSVFLVSLVQFSLRSHGPMGQYRLDQLLGSFPWWTIPVAVVGLVAGVIILRRYEVVYKHNAWLVVSGFILSVLLAGILINLTCLDNIWLKRGPMRGMLRNNSQTQTFEDFRRR
jgi:cobalamin biosynthesis protein CobD/CbiB